MSATSPQSARNFPVRNDHRRVRIVQKRTLLCWMSLATVSKPRSAMSKGPSQTVTFKKRSSEYGTPAMYEASDGYANTAPVGSFPAGDSPFGLSDVVGNVWEWTADWYAPYSAAAQTNPKGPDAEADGAGRVIRGGAWNGAYVAWVRPTFRYHDAPTKRSYGIGFRCAADVEP